MRKQRTITIFSAVMLGWLLPALAWGQVASVAGTDGGASGAIALLRQQAAELFDSPADWGQAGDLLAQAGQLSAVEDPAGVSLLLQAARLQTYAGKLAQARANMKEVGWRALGQGRLEQAANAYADAAIIAVKQGDEKGARALVDIVRLLARWPGVTRAQRQQILARL